MSNLSKYTNLHALVQRIGEDDLTEDQTPEASVAYTIGSILQSAGTTLQETALRIHNTLDKQAVDTFYAGLHDVIEHTSFVTQITGEIAAPFGGLREDPANEKEPQLREAVNMFAGTATDTVLMEAQEFLFERLAGDK